MFQQNTPNDIWQLILTVFAWAWRIPVACFVVFTAGCAAFLGLFFVYRATVWIFLIVLKNPW